VYPTASLSISELLSKPYLLNIPVFQRPYSWGREQAEQLLDDLMEAAGLGLDGEADRDYFLGAVVLMDGPGMETTKLTPKMAQREFGVIDGQQRLVTLMTLFAVLRDLEPDPRTLIAKHVQKMLVARQGSRFFSTERFRLHLGGRERVVFEENILQPGSTVFAVDSATSIQEATLLDVRDRFRGILEALPASTRKRLADFIANRCYVVVIVGTDIDRSHQMFVVLNERGKKLQRHDILKSDILSRLSTGDIGWAGRMWDDMSLALGDDFEAFFGHLRSIFGYGRYPIVSGVRRVIRESGGSEAFFKDVFLPSAKAYALIRGRGEGVLPDDMSKILGYLNRLADSDWAPAAILALKGWQKDPDRAAFLLAEIERLAMLTRLLCSGSGKRVRRFAELIKVMRSDEPLSVTHPILQMTRDELRSIAFHLRDLHKRNPKVCRLLLLRLSDEMGDTSLQIDPDTYTIEHVMPQRPSASSTWRQSVPSAEERGELVDCLGNLVLITQQENDKARNASWAEKKDIYGTTASDAAPLLAITREVLDQREWRRPEIEAREQRLIGLIEKVYRIDIKSQRPASRKTAEPPEPVNPLSRLA
jgi:hypothetical protein